MKLKCNPILVVPRRGHAVFVVVGGLILFVSLLTALVGRWLWGIDPLQILTWGGLQAVLVPLLLFLVFGWQAFLQPAGPEQIGAAGETPPAPSSPRPREEMLLLNQLGILLAAGKDLSETLFILHSEIVKLAQVDTLYVAIYDARSQVVEFPIYFRQGWPEPHASRKLADRPDLTGAVLYQQRTLYVPDIQDAEVIRQYAPAGDSVLRLRTYLGIPLVVNEQVIGVLAVQSVNADAYTTDQIRLLENVALQAAIAIDKARLLDRLKQQLKERESVEAQLRERELILEAVTFAAEQFLKTADWRANIDRVLERLGRTLTATHAYLFEDHLNAQGEPVTSMRYEWTAEGFASDLDSPYFQNAKIRIEGYEEQVDGLRRGEVRVGSSATFNPIERRDMEELGVKAILEVPVFVNEQEWGVIGFDDLVRVREWSTAEVEALKIAAGVLSAAIQRQLAESAVHASERIYRQAIEAAGAVPYYQDYQVDRYQFIGQGIQKITGYGPEEMSASLWSSLVQESVLVGDLAGLDMEEAIRRVRSGELTYWKCDHRILARDGQSKWIAEAAIELFDESQIAHASIGIMQDITERKQTEANLRQREAMLEAITFAAEQFLMVSDWRTNIEQVLQQLGRTLTATHAYLFEHHLAKEGGQVSQLTYEWTAPGFRSDFENPYYQEPHPLHNQPGSSDQILARGEVFVGNSHGFPPAERARLEAQGVKALVEVPLAVNGGWWGTLGFADVAMERTWSLPELEALKIAAGILSAAIQRQETESAVRESERIYRQAIEAAGAVPYVRDHRLNSYPFIGAGIHRLTGYPPEAMSPARWASLVQEMQLVGDLAGLEQPEAIRRVRHGEANYWKCDYRILAKDGQVRWIADSAIDLFDDTGVAHGSIGIMQDITERKQIEASLRQREGMLEATTFAAEQFLQAPDWRGQIVAVLERLGREFNASHAYLFEWHIGPDQQLVSSMTYEWTAPNCHSDLGDPEFQNLPLRSMGFERLYDILDQGDPLVGSASFFTPEERQHLDGMGVKAILEMRVIVDGQQWGTMGFDDVFEAREWTPMEVDVMRVACNVLGAAIKRQNDQVALRKELDERQRLIGELEIRNAESETLRESAAIVTATLEISQAVDRILEQLAMVVHYHSASVQLLRGQELEIVSFRGLEGAESCVGLRFALDEGEPALPVIRGELPFSLYEDVQRTVPAFQEAPHARIHAWLAVPLRVKGVIIGIIALDGHVPGQFSPRDAELAVTYANQVAIALENARLFSELQAKLVERQALIHELESKNGELERFTYTVSHDLKSPLVTISGFLGYLEQDAASGNLPRMHSDILRIREAVRKMQALLAELLELSRIGRVVNPPVTVAFGELVEDAILLTGGQLEARQVSLRVQPDLPAVSVDRPRIVEVLQNLIDNAVKYMGDQPQPQIEIGQRGEQDGMPVFYVRDNGLGIAPEFHERVFGLFNKLDPRSEGTGVGLALVKRILEVHGGRVWLESQPARGSTFLFTLPPAGRLSTESVI